MLKIKTFRTDLTPNVGTLLAGYGAKIISDGVHDSLYMSGIAFENGKQKAVLISFDLLGLEAETVKEARKTIALANDIKSEQVVITCTHTHSGPHTRISPDGFRDEEYLKFFFQRIKDGSRNLFKKMTSVKLLEYTAKMEENINRRVVFPWNKTEYLPVKKHLRPLADGIRDNRLGMLYFVEANHKIATTLVNYAAHPLTCQSDGSSSLKISSDYPGVLRNIVEKDLGGFCIFTQGACGDLHPKYYEHGFEKTEEMGKKLAAEVISSFSEPRRFEEKYLVNNPVIETRIIKLELEASKIADSWHGAFKKGKTKVIIAEVQILRIGDICFVGVPGEILVEPALEIVWNSPFKKTYILYNSTAYLSYLNHANAFYSGGYEPGSSNVSQFATFDMIAAIVHEFKKMKV